MNPGPGTPSVVAGGRLLPAGPRTELEALEDIRDEMLVRLHARSDDFAATKELQDVQRQIARIVTMEREQAVAANSHRPSVRDRLSAMRRRRRGRNRARR